MTLGPRMARTGAASGDASVRGDNHTLPRNGGVAIGRVMRATVDREAPRWTYGSSPPPTPNVSSMSDRGHYEPRVSRQAGRAPLKDARQGRGERSQPSDLLDHAGA